jgi:hypothetical protein
MAALVFPVNITSRRLFMVRGVKTAYDGATNLLFMPAELQP